MSAFICGPDHFKQLAIFAVRKARGGSMLPVDPRYLEHPASKAWLAQAVMTGDDYCADRLATFYADLLYQENVRSVRARYPDDKWDELAGPCIKPLHMVVSSEESHRTRLLPAVALLKLCDCLEYQSCETEDWKLSAAFELLGLIRGAAISALPGYEQAPWDYYADEARAA